MLTDELVPMRYVYAGIRLGADKKPFVELYPMHDDGALEEGQWYQWDKKARSIGGIYKGGSFSTSKASWRQGIYTGEKVEDESKIIMWEAKNTEALTRLKSIKLEGDARKQATIIETLAPLRELYTKAMSVGDYAGAHALETAVIQALKKPYRNKE
jgi:hypothetical protein